MNAATPPAPRRPGPDSADLLRAARCAGYPFTDRQLETLRTQGLIPRPHRALNRGVTPVWVYPPGTERQIVFLGRWRQRTKDPEVLRVLLWLEGFPIPTEAVEIALLRCLLAVGALEDRIAPSPDSAAAPELDTGRDPIESLAAELAAKRGPKALPRPIRQSAAERARAIELMFRTFGRGESITVTDDEAFELERLLGLAPGRRHKVDGVGPWITGSPHQLLDLARTFAPPALFKTMLTVTEAELEEARPFAHTLFYGMPLAARLLGAIYGNDNYAGFGFLANQEEKPFLAPLILAVVVAVRRTDPKMTANLTALHSSMQALPDTMAEIKNMLEMPQSQMDQNLAKQPAAARRQLSRVIEAALEGKFEGGLAL
ncbi:hypothetical protein [Streptomyces anulatus]|uniref:hypothetical protein n=1 Tax=Streptomyces anulatus TaxID=1892 RepID=UPI0016741949|nr:hypothetical protein [Streptomyces anulatus]GGY34815.1 hypothetical protein GCM10010342_22280 [Streptomyces anulatus]